MLGIKDNEKMDSDRIYKEFHAGLLGFIRARVKNSEDAEDILQEVFLRVHKHSKNLPDVESYSGWLYRITRNVVIDYYRARDRGNQLEKQLQNLPEIPANSSGSELTELSNCLMPFTHKLEEPYREAVQLVEWRGKTNAQAAEILGISVSGVKSRVQRGRLKLKALLGECCSMELNQSGDLVTWRPRGECGPSSC